MPNLPNPGPNLREPETSFADRTGILVVVLAHLPRARKACIQQPRVGGPHFLREATGLPASAARLAACDLFFPDLRRGFARPSTVACFSS
jgi:hypothetical protein